MVSHGADDDNLHMADVVIVGSTYLPQWQKNRSLAEDEEAGDAEIDSDDLDEEENENGDTEE